MERAEKDTRPAIKLYQYAPAHGLAGSASPACMKLETWLRMTKIPYEMGGWPSPPPPKGKMPFIDDGGMLIADSTLIIEHLKRTRGVDPDEGLTAAERAVSHAFRRMLKENFYWVLMHIRYVEEPSWEVWKADLLGMMLPPGAPDEARQNVVGIIDGIQKNVKDQLHAHGLGRHTAEEIHRIGIADLTAVSDFLGDKAFFFGDRPTGVDATLYAHLAQLFDMPFDSASTRFAKSRQNLVDYCARMRAKFYA